MKQPPLSGEDFGSILGLDPASLSRLRTYLDLLCRWQPKINLVSASTLADPWRRHMLDSAQLAEHLPSPSLRLIDLGSGAGFPGLVLAILTTAEVTLVEADARKCAFLAEAARITGTAIRIHHRRIEDLAAAAYEVVTARAVAPLGHLLRLARPLLAADGVLLALKGREFARELTLASKAWKMRLATWPSRSDAAATVARIDHIEPIRDG